jgi:hypothetical protein
VTVARPRGTRPSPSAARSGPNRWSAREARAARAPVGCHRSGCAATPASSAEDRRRRFLDRRRIARTMSTADTRKDTASMANARLVRRRPRARRRGPARRAGQSAG